MSYYANELREHGRNDFDTEAADELDRLEDENSKLRDLCREAYHALNCGEEGDVFERSHRCGRCDDYVDRNGDVRGRLALAFVMTHNVELRRGRESN